jgi:hypothetical protein
MEICTAACILDYGTQWRQVENSRAVLIPQKIQLTHWIGYWIGPRVGMDVEEKREFLRLPEI